MLYVPSHWYPNLASLETNQDSLFSNFPTQSLVTGSPLKFFIFKFKNYPWFKDSTHYYWPVPTNYTCLHRNKKANAPNWAWMTTRLFLFFTCGEIFVKSKASYYLYFKTKQNKNANLPKGDKGTIAIRRQTGNIQMLLLYCYIDAFCAWRASSLTWYN